MAHYKCAGCRIRLNSAASSSDFVGALCPGCGAPLEPVGDLSEIVGFQSITFPADTRLDADRWLDDGGSLRAEAVALPIPETEL